MEMIALAYNMVPFACKPCYPWARYDVYVQCNSYLKGKKIKIIFVGNKNDSIIIYRPG